jgi:putative ABC transport system permease protein
MTWAELKVVVRLVAAQARQRPGRVLLTSLSTVAAACVVVWVVSGYDALVKEFGGMGEGYVGRYGLLLLPRRADGPAGPGRQSARLPKGLVEAVRRDPAVAVVDPAFETPARVGRVGEPPPTRPNPTPAPAMPSSGPIIMGGVAQLRRQSRAPTLVGTDSAEPPHPLLQGRWFDPRAGRPEGALTREAAEQLGVGPGDDVAVTGVGPARGAARVRVVGILEQPKRLPGPKFMVGLPPTRPGALPGGPATHALYVSTAVAEELSGLPAKASYAGVLLEPGAKAEDFLARWSERFSSASPSVEARTAEKVDREVGASTTFETVRAQAYSATAVSLLAALFIIFTTLSMGVDERVRQFAVLRAVAFTRRQVGAMVAIESVLLGLVGWGGGLLAGWGLLRLMARLRPEALSEGAALGGWCVALSGVCALGGSLAASVLPAWRATTVSPLEAMAPRRSAGPGRLPWALTLAGLVLIAVNPLVVFYLPMKDASRYAASAAVGCTSMVVGFLLLAPLAVVLTERGLGPVLARLLGLNPRLLATQLSANLWRTVGTTVALSIGLGLFVALQTWGYSMLAPFTPGDWAPDLLVAVAPAGVPDSEIDAVRHVRGLATGQFLPLAFKQVKFADDVTGARERASATRQDNCVMVGVDPDAALGGDSPVFRFRFVEGTREGAVARLKAGRACLVPDHFARESGLGVGRRFRVIPPNDPDAPLEYEIAGVVSMPGWHWMSKVGLRRARAAGLMFCSYQRVRADFRTGRTTLFWGNTDGTASEEQIKAAVQAIADRHFTAGAARPRRGRQGAGPPREARGASVTVRSAEAVRKEVRGRADNIIWALSELPLVTLLVTSLGAVNTVLSSVRARQWEMGVLRALGVTRSGLFRLIVGESLLVGGVACVLSLGFGTMAGYCGTGVTRYVDIRGGMVTPLVVPWSRLSVGFGIALGLCLLAAVWPAYRTGRAEPLRLLQAGRAAA